MRRRGSVAPAASRGEGVAPAAGRARAVPTSLERIEWVIGLDGEPVRRNLLITQTYHDLSAALAHALGPENANWCTFATWASRTAGRFVREDEVPHGFRLLLGRFEPVQVTLARVNAVLSRDGKAEGDSLLDVVHDVVQDVAALVTAGNLAVFGELAPVFSRALEALAASRDTTALDALADSLAPGPSDAAGQALLGSALRHYGVARVEADPRRKAALMLLANGQVGLHEQIRLQPFIAGSIDAPIRDAVAEALQGAGRGLPAPLAREVHALVGRLLHPVADGTARLWEEFSTRELMTLSLPGGNLVLGRDLPAPRGAPLYPTLLDPIAEAEATELLAQYGADRPNAAGSAAVDWAHLPDRMRYILQLFRSRQCDGGLLTGPFTAEQHEALLDGRAVHGRL